MATVHTVLTLSSSDIQASATIVDSDQTSQNAASDQGLQMFATHSSF